MKNNKTQMALIVATALLSMTQAHAYAPTISITSHFTPLEDLNAQDRVAIQMQVEKENPLKQIDWDKSILGKDEDGKIEVRDKENLKLIAHIEPTCS